MCPMEHDDKKYIRKVQTSVTNFLHYENEYLFLKRNANKRIDPNKLNGIGGRVEPGEDYLAAAIRETEEETGYIVKNEDIKLTTIGKLEGGYSEDWVMCFFKIKVHNKKIPHGHTTEDGEFLWLSENEIFSSAYELVDDLNYVLKDIINNNELTFFNAQVNSEEKIEHINISKLGSL